MGPWLLVLGFSLQSTGPLPPWLSHMGGSRGGSRAFCSPVGGAGRVWSPSGMLTASELAVVGGCVYGVWGWLTFPPPTPQPQAGDGGKEEGATRVGRVL